MVPGFAKFTKFKSHENYALYGTTQHYCHHMIHTDYTKHVWTPTQLPDHVHTTIMISIQKLLSFYCVQLTAAPLKYALVSVLNLSWPAVSLEVVLNKTVSILMYHNTTHVDSLTSPNTLTTRLLTHSLACSLTHSLAHSLTFPLTHPFPY